MTPFGALVGCTLALSLAGCVFVPLGKVPRLRVTDLASGTGSVKVVPRIDSGLLKADTPRIQALVEHWTAEDVNHVVIKLFRVEGAAEVPVIGTAGTQAGKELVADMPGSDLARSLAWSNLAVGTAYRIRAWAYRAPGEDPANLLNETESGAFVDFHASAGGDSQSVTLAIKLRDTAYDAEATSSLAFKDGKLLNSGTEALQQ